MNEVEKLKKALISLNKEKIKVRQKFGHLCWVCGELDNITLHHLKASDASKCGDRIKRGVLNMGGEVIPLCRVHHNYVEKIRAYKEPYHRTEYIALYRQYQKAFVKNHEKGTIPVSFAEWKDNELEELKEAYKLYLKSMVEDGDVTHIEDFDDFAAEEIEEPSWLEEL